MAVVGIDLGTGSTKAAVVADDGRTLGRGSAPHRVVSPAPGAAESMPDEWERAVATAVRRALDAASRPHIDAIGLSGQMHGVVCADARGGALGPALLWPDTRAADDVERLRALDSNARAALANPLVPGMYGPLLSWLRARDADARADARWALSPKDWLRARLTGAIATEPSDASATLLWDVPGSRWSAAALEALDIPAELLPPVVASTAVAGELHADGAAMLGLPAGTPVDGGAADVAAALAGTGLARGEALLSIGTGAQLVAPTGDVAPVADPAVHHYRTAEVTGWYAMGAVQNAGLALDWVRDVLGVGWDALHDSLDTVPPGAGGVTFHPYLTGERTPVLDATLRASWRGLALDTRREALCRAALEGVAFALRDALDALVAADVTIDALRLVGGGGGDRRWRRLLATALDRPLHVDDHRDASAVGAARLAARAIDRPLPARPSPTHVVAPSAGDRDAVLAAWSRWRRTGPLA